MHSKKNSASKVYVVFSGKRPGIYYSWSECSPIVIGVKRSIFQSFKSHDVAILAFDEFEKSAEGKQKLKYMVFVVFCGKKPGIYKSWSECVKMLVGVEGSYFHAFQYYDEALKAFNQFKKISFSQEVSSSSSAVEKSEEVVTNESAASAISYTMLVSIFIGLKLSENVGKSDPAETRKGTVEAKESVAAGVNESRTCVIVDAVGTAQKQSEAAGGGPQKQYWNRTRETAEALWSFVHRFESSGERGMPIMDLRSE
uniref:Uncharacterized protein LOC104248053 n=2 Tax=Nicotiana sylvestris TaxID=4096 RepID=A0A1U7YEK0_NICSY